MSKVYLSNGNKENLYEQFKIINGKSIPFFRKSEPAYVENRIASMLKVNPHPNIVTIYDYSNEQIDMELLNVNIVEKSIKYKSDFIVQLTSAKQFLNSLGIAYIDWKSDNVGYSETDKCFKLFDFDGAGIFDVKTKEWITEPPEYYVYRHSIKHFITIPEEIDNYGFYNQSGFFV